MQVEEPQFKKIEFHVLYRMVDKKIIKIDHKSIETIASKVGFNDLQEKYSSNGKIKHVLKNLRKKGFVDFPRKSRRVASATDDGIKAAESFRE